MRNLDFVLLIPCYNNFSGLVESLKSVVYKNDNYLVLVVDDGSEQPLNEKDILLAIGAIKPIRVLTIERNFGITTALNKGLEWIERNSSSRYIARLDCGDLNEAERFSEQVKFLDEHSKVGLIGSYCRFIDEKTGEEFLYKSPSQHADILRGMYYKNVFMHATVMFRTSLLSKTGYYPEDFNYVEDYALFWKMIEVSEAAILEKILVTCKVNRGGISFSNKGKQLVARWRVVKTFAVFSPRKIVAFLRLFLLYILPKELVLRLKKMRG